MTLLLKILRCMTVQNNLDNIGWDGKWQWILIKSKAPHVGYPNKNFNYKMYREWLESRWKNLSMIISSGSLSVRKVVRKLG